MVQTLGLIVYFYLNNCILNLLNIIMDHDKLIDNYNFYKFSKTLKIKIEQHTLLIQQQRRTE